MPSVEVDAGEAEFRERSLRDFVVGSGRQEDIVGGCRDGLSCLPLLEPLRQPIDLDRLDPLKTAAQGDAEILRLRRSSLEAKDPPVGDQPRREETLWWCASDSLASRRFRQPHGFGYWRGKSEVGQWS